MGVKKYKASTINKMKQIGTYKVEFEAIIDKYCDLLIRYDNAVEAFKNSGGDLIVEHTNKAGATNQTKNPYYQIIENLDSTIVKYSAELGLTPAGLKKINDKSMFAKKESVLEKALSKLE